MAVFWKHIKGTGNATANENGLWTWINWSTEDASEELQEGNRTMSWAPEIWCKRGNGSASATEESKAINLGHIITSDNLAQTITSLIQIPHLAIESVSLVNNTITITQDNCTPLTMSLETFGASDDAYLNIEHTGLVEHFQDFHQYGNIKIGASKPADKSPVFPIVLDGNDGKCEARYFNATSDKRAKENIMPVLGSALEIIKQVQVYTFNYKDQQRRTIGLIAQELIDKPLDGVNFVFNAQASGVDGDYMNISESKLVYLLLKAIQEQQTEINHLKMRLELLEDK